MKKRVFAFFCLVLLLACLSVSAFADGEEVTAADFNGKRIAIQEGTTYVTMADEVFDDYQPYYYANVVDCVTALSQGKVDAVLADEPVLRYCTAQVGGVVCISHGEASDPMASIAAKNATGQKYVNEFNEYYRALVESGERDRILQKWQDGSPKDYVMEDYTKYPATNGTLVIATEATFPPLQFMVGGVIMGYETELWAGFCKQYGYKPQFENVSFGGIIAGITSGKYDIGASGFSVTDERKQQVLFTDVILQSGACIAYSTKSAAGFTLASLVAGFRRTFVQDSRWKSFLKGFGVTAQLTVFSILLGTLLGFGFYMLRRTGIRFFVLLSEGLKRFIVGMPVVVWLMVLYYVIFGKSKLDAVWVAIIGFSVLFAFSMSSMLAAGESSVDPGQALAAEAMGYSKRKTFFRIILPQAARFILPSFEDEAVAHMKATAIVGYIAVVDVTKVGDLVRGMTYDAFFPLVAVAAAYFLLAGVLRLVISVIRKKTNPRLRSRKAILKGVILK